MDDIFFASAEGTGGFDLDGGHGGGKAASFIYGSTFGTLIQVTGHISVAAAGGINHFSGFVGRYFMECFSIVYNRAQAAPT